jgi:hypothetical protein
MKPLAIDLFCGLGGWAKGFLAEGYTVIGFDIERHDYGTGGYPGQLVLQDVTTLHGSQFKNAAVIVASPPCQAYSYRAMPWKRAKALPPPDNTLFETCFRIQREAIEARCGEKGCCDFEFIPRANRTSQAACRECFIPLVVENVRGAQKWVGRPAAWNFGSFYLWGDVPALMPPTPKFRKSQHTPLVDTPKGTGKTSWFFGNSKHEGRHYGVKSVPHRTKDHWTNPEEHGTKIGGDWFSDPNSTCRKHGSKSKARKAASAQIAKIPFRLANHIARVFKSAPALQEKETRE